MAARKIALGSLVVFVLLAATELGIAVFMANTNRHYADVSLQNLTQHQSALLDSIVTSNKAIYEYESSWILRNAREFANLQSLELKSDGKVILQLNMGDSIPAWLLGKIIHTPDPTRNALWTMTYNSLKTSDYIMLLRVALIIIITWIAFALIMVLSATAKYNTANPELVEPEPSPKIAEATSQPEPSKAVVPIPTIEKTKEPTTAVEQSPNKKHELDFMYRLEHELSRSAEHALDLSICLIRAETFANQSELGKKIILTEFTHDDLIFQVDNRTFGVILPHNDLDQAMARMELFLRKTQSKPEESAIFKTATAGLSSRSGRLVEARRVYREAGIALRKAEPDAGRIAGFRADPGRYRNYLTHHKV